MVKSPSSFLDLRKIAEKNEPKTQKQRLNDEIPLLFIDVNIDEFRKSRIIIYEGDKAETVAKEFAQKHSKANFF